jgi:tRNA1(Val) A37 N6-methylase TrmN6
MSAVTHSNIGKKGENTKTVELVSLLQKKGFSDANFERIFKIIDPLTRKPTTRKPDVVFSDGGTNVISAKDGESLERQSVSSAYSYLRDLAPVTRLSEVFALTYPKPGEKFHLHILPLGDREEISLVLSTLEQVAKAIVDVVQGRIAALAGQQEPTENEARRILQYTAYELADSLSAVPEDKLETVFGGHDFFRSVFQKSLKGKERQKALRLGTAFLFINQILFYTLLSQAAKTAGVPERYPEIELLDKSDPQALQEKYFEKVKAKDYEPIYGPALTQYFKSSEIGVQLSELIDTIAVLISKLQVSELVGQIFQSLIPFKIRKPLGAHYTNPNAAHLLAEVSIDSSSSKVMDLACGSGTLLVAAYRKKMKLASKGDIASLHRQFVEKDITGIDAMAFSSHLAAVNLALQQPLTDTDYVRIGTEDSTRLHPGDTIQPTSDMWPQELTQAKISDNFDEKHLHKKVVRIPSLSKSKVKPIDLKQVDVVIMNPPFTSQNNLAEDYKNGLKRRFSIPATHKKVIFWKTSQQVYFVLLADRFLNKNGTLAAVLPFTTFTGHAFHPLIEFLTKHFTVRSIVVGLGQSSFSEDTSLTECLLVASKSPARHDCSFRLVGTKLPPSLWTDNEIKTLSDAVTKEQILSNTDTYVSKVVPQKELLPEGQTLSLLYLRLNPDFEQAWESLQAILSNPSLPLKTVKDWFADGLKMDEVYHGRDRPLRLGPKAILMCRNIERAIKNIDRLVLKSKDHSSYTFFDRFSDKTVLEFPKSEVAPALRRFAFLDSMDITNKTDFCVSKPGKATEKSMHTFYTKEMSKTFLRRLVKDSWKRIQANGSSKVAILARADLAAPGTKLIAFYSEEPYFLAGAYGYNVRGFKNETDEKLFVLWMNSSLALLQLLAKSTITRGSWVKLEQFTTEQVVLPNVSKLTKSQRINIEKMWKVFSKTTVSSLLEQFSSSKETRLQLDSAFLELLGVPKMQASQTAQKLEKGVLGAIQMLKATMKKGHVKKGAGKPLTKTLQEFLN